MQAKASEVSPQEVPPKFTPRIRGPLSPHDRALLRAESFCDESTIRAWAAGAPVREATHLRLSKVAKKIGLLP
jgi:hypothetical protein